MLSMALGGIKQTVVTLPVKGQPGAECISAQGIAHSSLWRIAGIKPYPVEHKAGLTVEIPVNTNGCVLHLSTIDITIIQV
jgi:hypothetical protein